MSEKKARKVRELVFIGYQMLTDKQKKAVSYRQFSQMTKKKLKERDGKVD